MLKDRQKRPCWKCGTAVHFNREGYRLKIVCRACGARVTVPLGRTVGESAVSMDASHNLSKTDHSMGFLTTEEWRSVFERDAAESIRRWEETVRSQSHPEICRRAKDAAFKAIGFSASESDGSTFTAIVIPTCAEATIFASSQFRPNGHASEMADGYSLRRHPCRESRQPLQRLELQRPRIFSPRSCSRCFSP